MGPAASGLPVARPPARRLRHRGVAGRARVPRRHATACGRSSTGSASSTARAASIPRSPASSARRSPGCRTPASSRPSAASTPCGTCWPTWIGCAIRRSGRGGNGSPRRRPRGSRWPAASGTRSPSGSTPAPERSRRWERTFSTDLVVAHPRARVSSRAGAGGSGDRPRRWTSPSTGASCARVVPAVASVGARRPPAPALPEGRPQRAVARAHLSAAAAGGGWPADT